MHRLTAIITLSVALLGCTNPMPFGPGRVEVQLDDVSLAVVKHSVIFPGSASMSAHSLRRVVRFDLSSQTDLLQYFKHWEKEIQVRCSVLGSANGKSYRGFATWPMPRAASAESSRLAPTTPATERHRYMVYAFVDLTAEDEVYRAGKPVSKLNLETEKFDALSCHLLGVSMTPSLWPRSNDFTVKVERFRELHRQAHFE